MRVNESKQIYETFLPGPGSLAMQTRCDDAQGVSTEPGNPLECLLPNRREGP